jgi:hypothetical protein
MNEETDLAREVIEALKPGLKVITELRPGAPLPEDAQNDVVRSLTFALNHCFGAIKRNSAGPSKAALVPGRIVPLRPRSRKSGK